MNQDMRVVSTNLGPVGTGSKFFRCGIVHSSGTVYLGTYGPAPALVWKYDPAIGRLEQVAAPGEYQLDCMVEAPNGMIYIGAAYNGLVYKLDPATGRVTTLGTPPIASTPWIFTMTLMRSGEIYGAKGVGLFRLDWRRDRLEAIGVAPGEHKSLSDPITRQLEEAPDGSIWGDTNRWLFRFDPAAGRIELLADMRAQEPACYGLLLPQAMSPADDCYFAALSRFSGAEVKAPLYAYRAGERRVEPLAIEGYTGLATSNPEWWLGGGRPQLLIPTWREQEQSLNISVVDPVARKLTAQWTVDGNPSAARWLPGKNLYYCGMTRGTLLRADPARRKLTLLAENPIPIECRCLAVSPRRVIGADSYDCGHMFTFDPATRKSRDHGKVWLDDHRCNFGPAAFAGADGRYFLANHGEGMPALWVTDTRTQRHWRVGDSAVQLVTMSDGTVWGTTGENPPTVDFKPDVCWTAARQSKLGEVFSYLPGETVARKNATLGKAGPLAQAPGYRVAIAAAAGAEVRIYDPAADAILQRLHLPGNALAACAHGRDAAYFAVEGQALCVCRRKGKCWNVETVATLFGSVARGFFALPRSRRVLGIAADGGIACFDPGTGIVTHVQGPPPPAAGPAVDPREDAWFYADQELRRYAFDRFQW